MVSIMAFHLLGMISIPIMDTAKPTIVVPLPLWLFICKKLVWSIFLGLALAGSRENITLHIIIIIY